jgi:redox-sensitive bicupin YhaK (pirin superfamily)
MTAADGVRIRRSDERFSTVGVGIHTRHLLSFGDHYDPARTSLGPLIAHNDEVVEPGAGYAPHRHRGVDIVTWVVSGRLVHRHPGGEAVLGPGSAQALSAGSGITHEERADTSASGDGDLATRRPPLESTRFIQMWLQSDEPDAPPRHTTARFDVEAVSSGLVPIAAGEPVAAGPGQPAALPLSVRGAACHVGRLATGSAGPLPNARQVHVFVVEGDLSLRAGGGHDIRLANGDSVLITGLADVVGLAESDATIIVWTFGG